jgi:two-component system response regulator DesR
MKKIQVVVAEDQAMVLGALAALLETEPDIAVCARAANGREALAAVGKHKPDVLVTDIEMPEMTGLTLATEVRDRYPQTRVMILTTFARPGYLRRALDAGAKGYLLKDRPSAELADAVLEQIAFPDLALEAWDSGPDPLTERERQILWRAGEGKSSGEIAEELHLSEGTVRNYLSEAISKLGASNRVEAARLARARGWL